jgi:DNA primase
MKDVDVEGLLNSLNFDGVVRRGQNIMACCPSHDERRPSWGVSVNAPYLHACFSCGFKGSLPHLLRTKFNWTFSQIKEVFGADVFGPIGADKDRTLSFRQEQTSHSIPFIPEEQLWPFQLEKPAIRYLTGRGLGFRTIKKAGLLYHPKDQRVLFPWWWNGKLAGMTGRTIKDDDENKIVAYCGLKKSKLLYVPEGRGQLSPEEPVILVEGEIDALKVWEAGFKNVAALGHGRFSGSAIALLKSLPVNSLIVFTDNDRRGKELAAEITDAMQEFCEVKEVKWAGVQQKDAGDMSSEKIGRMIKSAERRIVWPNFRA